MNLIVWQKAMELFKLVWKTTFEESKIDFKLRAQVTAPAQSISANIAEGYGRRSVKEYIQFLCVAPGSEAEAMTRMMGLQGVQQVSETRFREFDLYGGAPGVGRSLDRGRTGALHACATRRIAAQA